MMNDIDFETLQMLRAHQQASRHNDTDKMITFIRGFCSDKHNPKNETLRALGYMIKKHQGQVRQSGKPYIVHPLSMACLAIGLGLTDDTLLAVILLHDVCEDTPTTVSDLPANETVKHGVKYMTIDRLPTDLDKAETKRRYYRLLLEDKNALICKALDRYSNLVTMVGVFEAERIEKNIRETHEMLMPVLKEAQSLYVEYSNEIFILRTLIRNFNDSLAIMLGIDLYQ